LVKVKPISQVTEQVEHGIIGVEIKSANSWKNEFYFPTFFKSASTAASKQRERERERER
jgi:hypothetical protein